MDEEVWSWWEPSLLTGLSGSSDPELVLRSLVDLSIELQFLCRSVLFESYVCTTNTKIYAVTFETSHIR